MVNPSFGAINNFRWLQVLVLPSREIVTARSLERDSQVIMSQERVPATKDEVVNDNAFEERTSVSVATTLESPDLEELIARIRKCVDVNGQNRGKL
ncbi:hypothetical protein PHJA_002053500 [Phtheirospermum japonicum]|uniref:Uncharacterized protein n=1 Tax=Phtheirospermum japonicum TaxID=374723 RepID=A0A830CII2_9LAMI|nr:hypothetical protein PHJA_002053500 [Phtheirospermum japonicum]